MKESRFYGLLFAIWLAPYAVDGFNLLIAGCFGLAAIFSLLAERQEP